MLQPLLFWSSLPLASHFVGPSATSADANDRQSKSCNIAFIHLYPDMNCKPRSESKFDLPTVCIHSKESYIIIYRRMPED